MMEIDTQHNREKYLFVWFTSAGISRSRLIDRKREKHMHCSYGVKSVYPCIVGDSETSYATIRIYVSCSTAHNISLASRIRHVPTFSNFQQSRYALGNTVLIAQARRQHKCYIMKRSDSELSNNSSKLS